MERAFNESATKSLRGREQQKKLRKAAADGTPIHKVFPAWLRLSKDKKTIVTIPEKAAVVRLVYQWASQGMGINPILGRLHREGVRPIGRSGKWCHSYVAKLLADRAVMCEYQGHSTEDGRRVKVGDPVPDYFPAIVSKEEWFRVRAAVTTRGKKERGRRGHGVANLFTGLIRDARDGQAMHLTYSGHSRVNNSHVLVSYGVRNGVPDAVDKPFPYDFLEHAFLKLVRELKAEDFRPRPEGQRASELAGLEARERELQASVDAMKQHVREKGASEPVLELLDQFEAERKKVAADMEALRAADDRPEVLAETQSMAELHDATTGEERELLRMRIKAKVKQLVAEMWLVAWDVGNRRLVELQIFFTNGQVRQMFFEWVRKGAGRGAIAAVTSNQFREGRIVGPGGPPPPTADLRNYRDPSFGGWYEGAGPPR
jgi:hypothetical protein